MRILETPSGNTVLSRLLVVARGIYIATAGVLAFGGGYLMFREAVQLSLSGLEVAERGTILFGTATVVLAALTIAVGLTALIGWNSLKRTMTDDVKREALRWKKQEREYEYAQGRFTQGVCFGLIGQYFARVHSGSTRERWDPVFFLDRAVNYTRSALAFEPFRTGPLGPHASNNLAYALAVRGQESDAAEAMRLVEQIDTEVEVLGSDNFRFQFRLSRGEVFAAFASTSGRPDLLPMTIHDLEACQGNPNLTALELAELDVVLEKLCNAAAGLKNET